MNRETDRDKKPNVVVIGGGTGLSVLLRGLKKQPLNLTAIVTVADDGGSSGRLRSEMQMPPPGDVRNVLLALADTEPLLDKLLQYRFTNGTGLKGHAVGNLLLAALTDITGDFVTGIKELSRVLAVRGTVLPASYQAISLNAELEDGTYVVGESKIPLAGKRIKRVFIEPDDVQPLKEAITAIRQADGIIVGPGSLFTSIIPNLLVPGITEAIRKAKAKKIYISNVMTQPGETNDFTVLDHLNAIYEHVGDSLFDYVIVNNGQIPVSLRAKYAFKGAELVTYDLERLQAQGLNVVADQLISYETFLRHDSAKLSNRIMAVLSKDVAKRGDDLCHLLHKQKKN